MPLAHDFDWDVIEPPGKMKVSSLRFAILPSALFVAVVCFINPAYAAWLVMGIIYGIVAMLVIDAQSASMETPYQFNDERRE